MTGCAQVAAMGGHRAEVEWRGERRNPVRRKVSDGPTRSNPVGDTTALG